jgi:hypothetical protein
MIADAAVVLLRFSLEVRCSGSVENEFENVCFFGASPNVVCCYNLESVRWSARCGTHVEVHAALHSCCVLLDSEVWRQHSSMFCSVAEHQRWPDGLVLIGMSNATHWLHALNISPLSALPARGA